MEEYFVILKSLIENISYPGAMVAVAYFGSKILIPIMPALSEYIRGRGAAVIVTKNKDGEVITLATIDERVKLLGSNHFHEVKDSLDRIEKAINSLSTENIKGQSEILQRLANMSGRLDRRNGNGNGTY